MANPIKRYTGVSVLEDLPTTIIEEIYTHKKIPLDYLEERGPFYPHQFLVLKDGQKSALGSVDGEGYIKLLPPHLEASGIKNKNKEQLMALSMLLNDKVPLNVITGIAGSGKTLLALAVAMEKLQEGKYERLILTRPMSQIGKYDLGTLPGDVGEKFNPYLMNYTTNLEMLVGRKAVQDALQQFKIEFVPIQLMRGASFHNCFIVADEVQVLPYEDMLAIGTRIGEGSKLVVMGDLNQRDEKIARDKTGIWKLTESEKAKNSPLCASIELIKSERSPLSALVAEIFEE